MSCGHIVPSRNCAECSREVAAIESEQLRAELAAAKAEVERVSKLYLEMRDGHEHVVHIMHADLSRHKRALEKCKEQRSENIRSIDMRELVYIIEKYDEEISRILEGKD